MKLKIDKKHRGFTLIEMLVVISITVILAMVSITNYRSADKRKRVALATDGIINAIKLAQTYTLAGRSTNNTDVNCRTPQFYYVSFSFTENYTIYALNNCGGTDVIQNFSLPTNTRIRPTSGLNMNGTAAGFMIRIGYYPPYAEPRGAGDIGALVSYTNATIIVESSDGTISRTITVDGISGRLR